MRRGEPSRKRRGGQNREDEKRGRNRVKGKERTEDERRGDERAAVAQEVERVGW